MQQLTTDARAKPDQANSNLTHDALIHQ